MSEQTLICSSKEEILDWIFQVTGLRAQVRSSVFDCLPPKLALDDNNYDSLIFLVTKCDTSIDNELIQVAKTRKMNHICE